MTGAGSGLGEATALALGEAGVAVAVVDRRFPRARQVADRLTRDGGRALAIGANISDPEQVERAVRETVEAFGRIDFLINNAGVDHTLPITELTVEQWDEVLGVNLRGPFLCSKAVFPQMQRQGGGHIVSIASTAGKRVWANASAYCASKAGLAAFTQALGVEGRPFHIKTTVVVPGGMRTRFFDRFDQPPDPANLNDPANVARAIIFALAQPAESAVPEIIITPLTETSWP